jgi:tRNA(fMet)-specific endonuclease VapC
MRYLADTNLWIALLKSATGPVVDALSQHAASEIAVCSVVKAELWHGCRKYELAAKRRKDVDGLLAPYRSLPFDDQAAEHYADIRNDPEARGCVIGPNDLKIASICRAHGLILVSANTSEFGRVAGLIVEDWSLKAHSTN